MVMYLGCKDGTHRKVALPLRVRVKGTSPLYAYIRAFLVQMHFSQQPL